MKKSFKKELLDQEDIKQKDLFLNLHELEVINKNLGGHKAVKFGFKKLNTPNPQSVLEIGCGGSDNLRALKKTWPQHHYFGLDLKSDCITFSEQKDLTISYFLSDYKLLNEKFDIIYNSLFCHHFTEAEIIDMLSWMNKNSTKGFFIADLHRNWFAYWSIKLITFLFSKSYLVKNDAPLSVKRGFTKNEWQNMLSKAGISNYKIKWRWAFRHVIIVEK